MDYSTRTSDLHAELGQRLFDFLRTDLGLCFTFVDLVKTEHGIGDREAAQVVLQKAATGYDTIARMVEQVQNADQKSEIEWKLVELRARLDDAHKMLRTE